MALTMAFTLAWATNAYATCSQGQDVYVACGAAWYNFYQNVDVCQCDCVSGGLVTNCQVIPT